MNWKWWENSKSDSIIFQKKLSGEGTERRKNPARGWYSIYTFSVLDEIDPEELRWSLRKDENIALVRINLAAYRTKSLDLFALENLKKILEFFAEYKKDVVLRPVYDLEGKGKEAEPDQFELVLQHAGQISQLLQKTKHSVMLWQGLLIGSWGEMHDSSYLLKEHLQALWKCLRKNLGDRIPVAVRTPVQWRMLVSEEDYKSQEKNRVRLTLFDDAIMGSATHLGTFGTQIREAAGWENAWIREDELEFEEKITRNLPFGGEVLSPQNTEQKEVEVKRYLDGERALCLLRQMHLTYLNQVYDRRILDQWEQIPSGQKGVWTEKSLCEYIGAHLGYRFLIRDVQIIRNGYRKRMKCKFSISNQGFARCMDSLDTELKISSGDREKEVIIPIEYDLSQLDAEQVIELEVLLPETEGDCYLSLYRHKDGQPVFLANKGAEPDVFLGTLHRKEGICEL